jgi:hypothetical protein
MTVAVEIGPRPTQTLIELEFVGDIDTLIESAMCSCAAGDNNPY